MKLQTKKYGTDFYVVGFYIEHCDFEIFYITRGCNQIQRGKIGKDDIIIKNEIDPGFMYAKFFNIEGIFHHFLVENPEFLLDSLYNEDLSRHDEFLSVLIEENLIPPHFYTGIGERATSLEWIGEEYRKEWGAK